LPTNLSVNPVFQPPSESPNNNEVTEDDGGGALGSGTYKRMFSHTLAEFTCNIQMVF
jgi:hypothetical protein